MTILQNKNHECVHIYVSIDLCCCILFNLIKSEN